MASAPWVALLVQLLILANPGHGSGVAPGDEEATICKYLRVDGAAPTPAYSANMRVLMDSWNYQNLLPPRLGAVWDQVDSDTRNNASLTTNWIQQSNTPCQQTVQVCGFVAGPQDNWLITQLINRTVNGTRLLQVSVTIEFELQNCDVTLNCQRTFNTHIYETSTENGTAARNTNNYQQVQRVSPDITTGARVNETIAVNFNSRHSSFYFAIQDETTCIVITRLLVFYQVCPSQTINTSLAHVPETIARGFPIIVHGRCLENAQTEDGSLPRFTCLPGGVWLPFNNDCRCSPGYAYNVSRGNGQCTSSNQLACESLDHLISNNINTRELVCVRKSDCSGLQCFSQNSFLRNFVELFDLTFSPCTKPNPSLWLQLLSREDPANNNKRNVILSRNVTGNGSVEFLVRSGGGDIIFGVYRFSANFSRDDSTVVIAVQLISSGVTISVVNYTEVWFDTGKCPIESTPNTTTDTPTAPPLITTTAVSPTSGPLLTPPEVEPHCSHVNWRNSPNVSCGDISGYVVRLFNPDTNETVERPVDARGTFHNFLALDKDLIEKKSTTVQVRIVSSTNIGPYSSPKEVGCYTPPPPTVYFELKGERYDNNSEINILSIGEGDNALLCKTDKQDCCGALPNRFGEFYYPNGVRVPINSAALGFYRNRGEQLIRLNRRQDTNSPTGRYSCELLDANGVNQKIFINITQ